MLALIKRWWARRRHELAAQREIEAQLDTLTDHGFIARLGK